MLAIPKLILLIIAILATSNAKVSNKASVFERK